MKGNSDQNGRTVSNKIQIDQGIGFLIEPMTATLLGPPDEIIHLSGISWQAYETLLEELSERRLRLTYNRGNLERRSSDRSGLPCRSLSWLCNGNATILKISVDEKGSDRQLFHLLNLSLEI